jgi:hypothetical protein
MAEVADKLTVIEGGNTPQRGSKSWCQKVRRRAKQLTEDLDTGYMELAQILYEVWDTPMDNDPNKGPIYKQWGFDSFTQWAHEDLNLQPRKAQRLRAIWYTLEVELKGMDPDVKARIIALGISKARELVRILDVDNAQGWVEVAEKSSYPVLCASIAKAKQAADIAKAQAAVKAKQEAEEAAEQAELDDSEKEEPELEAVGGNAQVDQASPDFGVPDPPEKEGPQPPQPVAAPGEPEQMEFLHFALYPEQYLNVQLALRKSGEMTGSDKKSHNLDMICTDFLANNDIVPSNMAENRMRFMRRMEQVFGIKIIALDLVNDEVVYGAGLVAKLTKGD